MKDIVVVVCTVDLKWFNCRLETRPRRQKCQGSSVSVPLAANQTLHYFNISYFSTSSIRSELSRTWLEGDDHRCSYIVTALNCMDRIENWRRVKHRNATLLIISIFIWKTAGQRSSASSGVERAQPWR